MKLCQRIRPRDTNPWHKVCQEIRPRDTNPWHREDTEMFCKRLMFGREDTPFTMCDNGKE